MMITWKNGIVKFALKRERCSGLQEIKMINKSTDVDVDYWYCDGSGSG